jgi:hypothetical protein
MGNNAETDSVKNYAVVVGENATFTCTQPQSRSHWGYKIMWKLQQTGKARAINLMEATISDPSRGGPEGRHEYRYIESMSIPDFPHGPFGYIRKGNFHNIFIPRVQREHAGTYECSVPHLDVRHSGHLVALEKFSCGFTSNRPLLPGHVAELRCSVDGIGYMAPKLLWKSSQTNVNFNQKESIWGNINKSHGFTVINIAKVTITPELDGSRVTCDLYYPPGRNAKPPPTYTSSCTRVLRVVRPPPTTTMTTTTPASSTTTAPTTTTTEEEILITAAPPPPTAPALPTPRLPTEHVKGTLEPPSPNIRKNVPRSAHNLQSQTDQNSRNPPVTGLAVGVSLLALAVLALLTYYYYASKGKTREEDKKELLCNENQTSL